MAYESLKLLPPGAKPLGDSFEEWIIRWWTWLLSIPKSENPSKDIRDLNVHFGQIDPRVIFLCQSFDNLVVTSQRRIHIRYGSSIFMPIINWISIQGEDGETTEKMLLIAKKKMDAIGDLVVKFNGKTINGLEKYRFASRPFEIELIPDNILEISPCKTQFISDGYWIFTEPIFSHLDLSTFGTCSMGITRIGISYSIDIQDG